MKRITKRAAARGDQDCFDAAVRYLGYRPRSEAEIRERLARRGFEGDGIERTVARLKEQGLLDDLAFARFWKENRETFRPRSRQLTRLELRRKGLDAATIETVVAEIDDAESAYRAALGRAPRLAGADHEIFRRRLGQHLRQRGFGYEVIGRTVARLWREHHGGPGPSG
jgi:regulatory protein